MVEFLKWIAVEYIKFALFFGVVSWIYIYGVNEDNLTRLSYAKIFVYSVIMFPVIFVQGIWMIIYNSFIYKGDKHDK